MDIQEQLAELRRKITRIDQKYATATPAVPALATWPQRLRPARYFVEELISGTVVATSCGEHFETEKLYQRHRRHGSMDISTLIELPEDLLDSLSGGTILQSHPKRWAFLDTETTGLAGGAGTYAFLIGVGSIDEEGFRVRQFFMRDFGDESSLLAGLTAVVPFAFRTPEDTSLRHGADLVGLARWLAQAERYEEAIRLYRRAVDLGLRDELLFKTQWEIGRLEKKLERYELALAIYTDLAAARNPYRVQALEELAKHYERRERNYGM